MQVHIRMHARMVITGNYDMIRPCECQRTCIRRDQRDHLWCWLSRTGNRCHTFYLRYWYG